MGSRPAMSRGELEVARVVWQLGEATVGAVFKAFSKRRRPDYTTVQTLLRRLEDKGYLRSRRDGRNKVYSARVRPSTVIGETVDDLMQRLFDGETLALMHHLIHERGISSEETQKLREMLARLEAESDEPPK